MTTVPDDHVERLVRIEQRLDNVKSEVRGLRRAMRAEFLAIDARFDQLYRLALAIGAGLLVAVIGAGVSCWLGQIFGMWEPRVAIPHRSPR